MRDLLDRLIEPGQFVAYANPGARSYDDIYRMTVATVVAVDDESGVLVVDRIANLGGPVNRYVRQRLVSNISVVIMETPPNSPVPVMPHPKGHRAGAKIPTKTVEMWRELVDGGWSQNQIARRYRVTQATVSRRLRGLRKDPATGKYRPASEPVR